MIGLPRAEEITTMLYCFLWSTGTQRTDRETYRQTELLYQYRASVR